jgi:hypothetical protein
MPDLTPWLRIKARYEAGEGVPLHVRKMAEEALGEKFAKPMKPARRPDSRDRAAGDDSFNDDDNGMVML